VTEPFPLWHIDSIEHERDCSSARTRYASTHIDVAALRAILGLTAPTELVMGPRRHSDHWLTILINARRQRYVADASSINVERQARESEVRELVDAARQLNCTVRVFESELPETTHLGPAAAAQFLSRQPSTTPLASGDAVVAALNAVLGRGPV
jgi:hypothetical protein